jgi:hypothetical protein
MRECNGALHAILLYDLELGTLTKDVVNAVAAFADSYGVPLFVDPKTDISKFEDLRNYPNIPAKVILPNRAEWSALVGEKIKLEDWNQLVGTEGGLRTIATTSFARLSMFTHHIVKCDRLGAVLVGPADAGSLYRVSRVKPHPVSPNDQHSDQLGFGDVMSAVFALEFSASVKRTPTKGGDAMLQAFRVANSVVACYRVEKWHRMPSKRSIADLQTKSPDPSEYTVTPEDLYMPRTPHIRMTEYATDVTGVVTQSSHYRTVLQEVLREARDATKNRNIVITGEGGSGKSQLINAIATTPKSVVFDVSRDSRKLKSIEAARRYLNSSKFDSGGLVVIDEAFKVIGLLANDRTAVPLLNEAARRRVRFVFVDADYSEAASRLSSQFHSRCEKFELPPIASRPGDIALIFGAVGLSVAAARGFSEFGCERGVLKAFVRWFLNLAPEQVSARTLVEKARGVAQAATKRQKRLDGKAKQRGLKATESDATGLPWRHQDFENLTVTFSPAE